MRRADLFPAPRFFASSAPLRSIGKRNFALRATRPKRRQERGEIREIDVRIAVDVALPARVSARSKTLQQQRQVLQVYHTAIVQVRRTRVGCDRKPTAAELKWEGGAESNQVLMICAS